MIGGTGRVFQITDLSRPPSWFALFLVSASFFSCQSVSQSFSYLHFFDQCEQARYSQWSSSLFFSSCASIWWAKQLSMDVQQVSENTSGLNQPTVSIKAVAFNNDSNFDDAKQVETSNAKISLTRFLASRLGQTRCNDGRRRQQRWSSLRSFREHPRQLGANLVRWSMNSMLLLVHG